MRLLHTSDVPINKRQVVVEEPVFITCEADAHIVVALAMFLGRTQPKSTRRQNYYGLLSLLGNAGTGDVSTSNGDMAYPYTMAEVEAVKSTKPFFYQCCPLCRKVYHSPIGATDFIVNTCANCNARIPTRHYYQNPLAHQWQGYTDPEIDLLNAVLAKLNERICLQGDAPHVKVATQNKEVTNE
jgi:hypothetical protein